MQYIKRDKVHVASVPQIEGLTIKDVLTFAKRNAQVLKHLPDERDWVHMDRKWICDVIYTLDKVNFQSLITKAATDRKARLEESRNLVVEMRPEFAAALNNCLNYSSKSYVAHDGYSGERVVGQPDEGQLQAKEDSRRAGGGQGRRRSAQAGPPGVPAGGQAAQGGER